MRSNLFFAAGTANTVALTDLTGAVGHQGAHGCRIQCPLSRHHKPGVGTYYPMAMLPYDCEEYPSHHCINNYKVPDNCRRPDINLRTLPLPDPQQYLINLQSVLASTTKQEFEEQQQNTGLSCPSICLGFQPNSTYPPPLLFTMDLMHLIGNNLPIHLHNIWHGKAGDIPEPKPNFQVLNDVQVWKQHGELVALMAPFFPGSFNCTPCNPQEKINSGYKAIEWINDFWVLGPAVFCLVLSHQLWSHFCKLVTGVRIIQQRTISATEFDLADKLLLEWVDDFEKIYCGQDIHHMHLVCPCVHRMIHLTPQTACCGPLGILAQWALKNAIDNLGHEIHQPSNPFMNLSECGLM